jgi:hypothetical protein
MTWAAVFLFSHIKNSTYINGRSKHMHNKIAGVAKAVHGEAY